MMLKEHILKNVKSEILDDTHPDLKPFWIAFYLTEALLDIRDHLFTITKTLQDMDTYHVKQE